LHDQQGSTNTLYWYGRSPESLSGFAIRQL
jgi:hypothetical protein